MIWRLSQKARVDLRDIWSYTADQWNADQADRYVDEIFDVCRLIAATPSQGRDASGVRPGYRKIRAGSHVLYFRVERGAVLIARILHERMDALRHL